MDSLEYLDENGSFQVGPFQLPSTVFYHCHEQLSETEVLIYGGFESTEVYILDFGNNGAVTPKAPLLPLELYHAGMSCGSFIKDGEKFVIYAGGTDYVLVPSTTSFKHFMLCFLKTDLCGANGLNCGSIEFNALLFIDPIKVTAL